MHSSSYNVVGFLIYDDFIIALIIVLSYQTWFTLHIKIIKKNTWRGRDYHVQSSRITQKSIIETKIGSIAFETVAKQWQSMKVNNLFREAAKKPLDHPGERKPLPMKQSLYWNDPKLLHFLYISIIKFNNSLLCIKK